MNPFRERILDYVEWQKVVRLDQLRSCRFVEEGYYDKKVCGTFEENLDALLTEGILKRAVFEVNNTEYSFIMVANTRFSGWYYSKPAELEHH